MARQFNPVFFAAGDQTNALDGAGTDVMVISAWVFRDGSATDRCIVGKWGNTVAGVQWGLGLSTGHIPYMQWSDGATLNQVTGSVSIPLQTWTHVYADNRPNAWGAPVIAVNGTIGVGGGTTRTVNMQDTSQQVIIGQRNAGSFLMSGWMADIAVWNMHNVQANMFTQSELNFLATGGNPLHLRRSQLAGYWPLLGAQNSPEPDLSGGGAAMFMNGGVSTGTAPAARLQPPGWNGR